MNLALLEIEEFLVSNNSSLCRFSHIPFPDQESISASMNPLMMEELAYDTNALTNDFKHLYISLTSEQKGVYNEIFDSWKRKKGGVFFVYGYGGTDKTYLWKTLSASIRSKGEIVLNVASSRIASLLLDGGITAHSIFFIPINLQVKGNTDVSDLLKKTSIWDEAPMIHKHAFEALDRTLKDVMKGNCSWSDFRQILPVVHNGTRNECVNATISSSYIWSKCKVLKLTKNMRLTVGSQMTNTLEIQKFADWLLDIGEGNLGGPNDGEATISIPNGLLIKYSLDPMSDLIEFVYPSMLERFNDLTYFQERALLAPLNEVVQEINDRMLSYFPDQEMEYLSSDSIDEVESVSEDFDPTLYSHDFLNGIKMSGMPNHRLLLKVGVPIMLLRNINQKKCLCNGTRLQVVSLGKHVIEAKVVSGTNIGFRTLISRISLTPSDKKLPFKLKRRQFPISVCFAMTINKVKDNRYRVLDYI
ncbi:uncharacterized protein LOC143628320 [Bidens hawaiensis]|uniref:uncharacterized protein LOC143628320 n=1 Tax=Bidens hawaiensis TaxID=980011 RepID=UPI00404AE9C1